MHTFGKLNILSKKKLCIIFCVYSKNDNQSRPMVLNVDSDIYFIVSNRFILLRINVLIFA